MITLKRFKVFLLIFREKTFSSSLSTIIIRATQVLIVLSRKEFGYGMDRNVYVFMAKLITSLLTIADEN